MRLGLARLAAMFALSAAALTPQHATAESPKPNILVIMGDDVGYWNISAYNRGMMGYRTPNIDRIAAEGGIFTDYYAQPSCTAGRAAFITGQSPMRTGLLKVGLPSAKEGLSDKDPTLAELLKPQGIFSSEDWVTTLMAAVGEPDIATKLLSGYDANGKTFKVHLDGYDQRDLLGGGDDKRREFFYWTDDGDLAGLRYDQWKVVFLEQPHEGLHVWQQPLVPLRAPLLFNLRTDPFERADRESGEYEKWYVERMFVMTPAQAIVGVELASFKDFPPRQKPRSFSVGDALDKLLNAQHGDN